MKLLTAINFVCLFIIFSFIAAAVYINHRERLVEDDQIVLPGLRNSVQIDFDKPSVPYIQARSQEDLIFAQGFVTASERFFQMDILRRLARGQMAAVFGGSCLPSDRLARIVGFRRLAQAELATLPQQTKEWLKHYCRGVNAYLAQGVAKLPLEFILLGYKPQDWQPEDTLAILKYVQYATDECWQVDVLQRMIKENGGVQLSRQMFGQWAQATPSQLNQYVNAPAASHTSILPINSPVWPSMPDHVLISALPQAANLSWGSNGWVIAKEFSQSEGCLLACDKHTLFTFPDLFFACSLRCPLVHVAGLTVPGVPGILLGRNDHIAWAPVSIKGHWQSLSHEQFSDKYPNNYYGSQEWLKAEEFQEEIGQRFANNVIEKVLVTRHGPLLVKNENTAVALNWYGTNTNSNMIESIWALDTAKDWSEFQSAVHKYRGSPSVFLYADTAGNIGKQIAGFQAKQLSVAATADLEQAKFIVANVVSVAASNGLASLGALSNNWSALRAVDVLQASCQSGRPVNLEDMIAMFSDVKAPLCGAVIKALRNALQNNVSIDQYQQNAFAVLANWDGNLKENSYCACVYESFLVELTRQVLKNKIGISLTNDYINKWPRWSEFTRQIFEKQPAQLLPASQPSFSVFIGNCFSQSLQNLRLNFRMRQMPGVLPGCQWQNMHQLDLRSTLSRFIPPAIIGLINPLLPANTGLAGDQDCINACNYSLTDKSFQYDCDSGPAARLIIDMADNDKFYQALTFGQCAHLFCGDRISETNNQFNLWRSTKFHAIAFSNQELDVLAAHHLSLVGDNN